MSLEPVLASPLSEQSQDLFFTFKSDGLPDADFVVTSFFVEETMSGLYIINLQLASRKSSNDLAKLTDQPGLLTIHDRYTAEPRYFHGVVASAMRGDSGHSHTAYSITMMPTLHRLRYGSDCRIFQNKSVIDIAKTLFQEHGIKDVEYSLSDNHGAREYLTQYHELHLSFLDRILAEEGVSYYFRHEKDKHVLVLTDKTIDARDINIDDKLDYNATAGGLTRGHYVNNFVWREQVTVTQVTHRDHFFKNPNHSFESQQKAAAAGMAGPLSIYHYPGRYKADSVGQAFSRYELEAYRKHASHGSGAGRCQYLSPGRCFTLSDYYDPSMNRRYFITSVTHSGNQPAALEEAGNGESTFISTSFQCIRYETPWRPSRMVKPIVYGPQMAIVSGPEGEEIYCDKYGRVKVTFPWDRYSNKDDTSSTWIRVASNWAGGMWGHIAIPRVGQHVIVDYLEGDPDQPIITGRAYNEVNHTPNTLPDFKTRMVLQSKTHKGDGYNELRFEDERDEEEVWLHAEKYLNAKVKNNETWEIGGSRHKRVDGSQSESVGGSKDIEVSGSHNEVINGAMSLKVEATRSEEITGTDTLIVHQDQAEVIKGNWTRKVERNIRIESEAHQHQKAPGTIFLDGGDKVVLRAGSVISLNVGGNFIRIDDSGITIEGTIVNINTGQGAPAKGMDVPMIEPLEAEKYQGPHAERYARSFKK